ncbi:peptidylprolyl isomerase [Lewinella sp. W8]|uniref:peptidylprolyl isomerase n=1 Tax=Lewinella sp. W8 TaxID=2528208 RepID=UPI0010681891|nr:peptidylprolyl isomerase [Lewinella sp. W8]MTB53595.1 peptidylprolyl isomerase [Lewinella sp. W8]
MRQLVHLFFGLCLCLLLTSCGGENFALIETNVGDIKVELYDSTPKHKENFVKLVNEGFYDGTLFHRVMQNFMIQGGDPMSKGAAPGTPLGSGGPGYLIDAEIGAPHLRGALAAARTGGSMNPEKKSSGSQFYIVTGQPQSEATLKQYETMKGIKYNDTHRQIYLQEGGRPDLDMEYTVFGRVVSGMEIVDAISAVATNPANRPNDDVVIERVTMVR